MIDDDDSAVEVIIMGRGVLDFVDMLPYEDMTYGKVYYREVDTVKWTTDGPATITYRATDTSGNTGDIP